MKNFFKLFGIIALAAVIGFSMAACGGDDDDDDGGGGGPSFDGTWTGAYNKYDGDIITATTPVTVVIQGNNITITAGDVTESGTLGEGTETIFGYARDIVENGSSVGSATIEEGPKLMLTLTAGAVRNYLNNKTAYLFISGMTK